MIRHFAYGANMSRAVMRKHAPEAEPIGVAALKDHRFVITADGYASVVPKRTETVYGVLWRVSPRDRVTLDAWENVAAGLYRAETVPVQQAGRRHAALIYVARPGDTGRAKAGYMELVIACRAGVAIAASLHCLATALVAAGFGRGGPRKLGEFGWT